MHRAVFAAWVVFLLVAPTGAAEPAPDAARFIRGDGNGDGRIDIADPLAILFHLFGGEAGPPCASAMDSGDDGAIDLADAVGLLGFLFQAALAPPQPYPACGADPSADTLPCPAHAPCAAVDGDPDLREWTVPWAGSRPRDPYLDGEGKVWFVGQNADYAAWLEPVEGNFRRFNLVAGAGPHNLIVGSSHVWYAGHGAGHIGRLEPETGEVLIHRMPDPAADDPHTLVFGKEGQIWFTVQSGNFVGRLLPSSGQVDLVRVPTASAQPYGIDVDPEGRPWVALFGTNRLASLDPVSLVLREHLLPRAPTRPRRLAVTPDGQVWYVDYSQGYLGRHAPASGEVKEWPCPGGASSRPYGMAADHLGRLWFVETGVNPNRMVGFNPATERFFTRTAIPSGGGTVRHMHFHRPSQTIWFGTDRNTIGRAILP